MATSSSWWTTKVRRFRSHRAARVSRAEVAEVATWTTPGQHALFRTMHVADQRHGLDVVASLRATGRTDPDLLLAGLLHDAGKGQTGVWPRVAWSLGEAYGAWVWRGGRGVARDAPLARAAPRSRRALGGPCRGRRRPGADRRPDPQSGRAAQPGTWAGRCCWRTRPTDAAIDGTPPGRGPHRVADRRARADVHRCVDPFRRCAGARARHARGAGRVRRPAGAAALADRGASARRPDGAARRAGRRVFMRHYCSPPCPYRRC